MPEENILPTLALAGVLLLLGAVLMTALNRRRVAAHPLERDANAALLKLRALGCDDARIRERLEQAVALETAGTSNEFIHSVLQVAARGYSDSQLAKLGLQRVAPVSVETGARRG